MFNKCIITSEFPKQLKKTNVSPLFKKDNPLVKKNYRPVSILTSISKTFEKLLAFQLEQFQDTIYHPYTSAFRRGHSCQSVLLKLTEDWRSALDNNQYVGTVPMDLSKAFDSMPIPLLISKLNAYGMHVDATTLLTSYLTERTQRVKILDTFSGWLETKKGVPQGSVLGPSLFNIFINDIYGFINKASLFNYADDNTLAFTSSNLDEIKTVLTNETQTAIEWFKLNMMEANPDKFQVMLLSKKETNSSFHLDVNGSTLIGESNVKLLGITIDSQMKFVNHTNILCSKAARQLNAVCRLKTFLDTESRLSVVRSFVTSNFSYCPVIWHFSGAAANGKMERILRRALRIISLDSVLTHESLLTKYDLCPLKTYRERCFALEVFKIKNSLAPKYLEDLIKIRNVSHNTRQKYSLSLPMVKTTNYGLHSFKYYSTKIWNSLPDLCKKQTDITLFKTSLAEWKGTVCKCSACKFEL